MRAKHPCILCGKDTHNLRFCSNSCSATFNNNLGTHNGSSNSKIMRYCLACGKQLNSKQAKFCCPQHQHDYAYYSYIERWADGLEDGLKGGYQISAHIRRYLFEKYDNKCSQCGWGETNPHTGNIPLEVEHKDGNYQHNEEDNLDLLCPNCHSLTATYKGANKGKGRKERSQYNLPTLS